MIPQEVQAVLRTLEQAGQAYVVGGCVRDMQMGLPPHDWDVTTSALPEETMALFPHFAIPTGLQHGTVTVRSSGVSCEVTTFRTDGDYPDHRHPAAVTFTRSLREDLARRDLTVNAMAMDAAGALHDPFGGREDIRRRVLRCVGDPERRFREDALRILRTLRFSATLGFAIEPETHRALRTQCGDLRYVAAERVQEELTKLLCGQDAGRVLEEDPQVLGVVLPEILPCVGFDQHNRHHCYDVWGHTAHAVARLTQCCGGLCCCTIWASPSASRWTSRAWDTFTATTAPARRWLRRSAAACGSIRPLPSASACWCGITTGPFH